MNLKQLIRMARKAKSEEDAARIILRKRDQEEEVGKKISVQEWYKNGDYDLAVTQHIESHGLQAGADLILDEVDMSEVKPFGVRELRMVLAAHLKDAIAFYKESSGFNDGSGTPEEYKELIKKTRKLLSSLKSFRFQPWVHFDDPKGWSVDISEYDDGRPE